MKKSIIFSILLLLLLSIFVIGCSDDDNDNGTTEPSINPEDYDYYMVVADMEARGDYLITIMAYEGVAITSIEISINGVDVIMTNLMNIWTGIIPLDEGQTYQVEMTLNENDYSFSIQTTYIPDVNWPANWIVTEPTTITWSLVANAEYQDLYATATDGITWDESYTDLGPSDRSFTIPANWVNPDLTDYTLMLMEMNFTLEDDLIVACMSADEAEYVIGKGISNRDKIEISKEIFKRIFNR
jgi:hypothetical protein